MSSAVRQPSLNDDASGWRAAAGVCPRQTVAEASAKPGTGYLGLSAPISVLSPNVRNEAFLQLHPLYKSICSIIERHCE